MTQQDTAVGGATDNDTVIAAEPSIEDRFAAITDDEQETDPATDEAPQGDEPIVEGEPELEADDIETDDLPPITAPDSWPDEDKTAFADLPRALQERVSAREKEREKFVQSKSREAAQATQAAEQRAVGIVQQIQQAQIQQLAALLPDVPEEPSAHLLVQDPQAYAAEMDYVRQMRGYRASIEQQIVQIAEAQKQGEQQSLQAQKTASMELLQQEFPELLDKEKGPELAKAIQSTGFALGYSDDQLANVDGHDVLALRTAMGWKTKAEKYDALMAKQMDRVRSAKELPRVSRPGSATTKGAVANQRYTADRQAMRNGDKDAAARVFSRFV